MLAFIFMITGSILEPQVEIDLPVNYGSGKVEIVDKIHDDKNGFMDLPRKYCYMDGKYRSSHLGKLIAHTDKIKGTGVVFVVELDKIGKVRFIKDSEHTFKPYYGQDFVFSSLENGSGVNHPDNIKVTTAGSYIILTYNDGRKLVYQHVKKKVTWADYAMVIRFGSSKKAAQREDYNLVKEYDIMGRCTEYFHDEDGYVQRAIKKDISGQELRNVYFYRVEKKENYSLAWNDLVKATSYGFKWMDGAYQFVYSYIGNACVDEFHYNKDHTLKEYHKKTNCTYKFHYRDQKVSKLVKEFSGEQKIYHLAHRDRQTDISTGDLTVSYLYDRFARIEAIRRSDGGCKLFAYYPSGAIKSVSYESCGEMLYQKEYSYDRDHNIMMFCETIDHKKSVWRYCYDDLNRKVEEIDPKGLKRVYFYEGEIPLCIKETLLDRDNEIETKIYTYDESNRVQREEVISGIAQNITTFAYEKDKPSCITYSYRDRQSYKESVLYMEKYIYENRRLVAKVLCDRFSDEIAREEFSYDSAGRVTCRKDLIGREEKFTYDKYSRVIGQQNSGKEIKTLYHRDDLIKKQEIVADNQTRVIEREYDGAGNVVKESASEKEERNYRYDGLGCCVDDNGVSYSYDLLGRVTRRIDDGKVTVYTYGYGMELREICYPDGSFCKREYLDGDGLIIKSTSVDGIITIKSFDRLGNLVKEVCRDKVYTYLYEGRYLVEKRGPKGYVHRFYYDGCGRVVREEGAQSASYEYDGFSNKVKSCMNGKKVSYVYDEIGRVIKESHGEKEVSYEYDDLGNIICKRINGNEISKRVFNGFSKIIQEVTLDRFTKYAYSKNKEEKCDGLGNVCVTTFNDAGNKIEEFLEDGVGNRKYRMEYEYNKNGKCTKTKSHTFGDQDHYKELSITYDPFGKILREEEKSKHGTYITLFVYDSNKRVIQKVLPDLVTINYSYDEYGRNQRIYASDNTIDYTIEYDLLDKVVYVKDGINGMDVKRAYDRAGNVIEEYFGQKRIAFSYKGANRTRCTFDDSSCIEYSYTDFGEIHSINRFDKEECFLYSHEYEYNGFGKVKRDIHPFGVFSTTKEYDRFARCIKVVSPLHYCCADIRNGKIASIENSNGDKRYAYDNFDQVIEENSDGYCYSGLYHKVQSEKIEFNKRGAVSFDGSLYYDYDALNRLVKCRDVVTLEEEHFFYDYYGRVRSHIDKEKKDYLYDGDKEIGFNNTLGIINHKTGEKIAIESEKKVLIPLYDILGNVACVVDPTKRKVKEKFTYSVFGKESIIEPNPFLFDAVEPSCPWRYKGMRKYGSKNIHIFPERAYNTELGMFLTKDPLMQSFFGSPYQYCYNNPLSYSDSDGLASEGNWSDFLPRKIQNSLQEAFSFNGAENPVIYYVNGLSTNKPYQKSCSHFLGQFFSQTIIPYYRPCKDSFFGVIAEYLGSKSKARSLARILKDDFKRGVSEVYLFGHSAGGSTIKKVLSMLSKQEAGKINVVTFGSAYLINPSKVKSCVNYYSSRDYCLRALQSVVFPQKAYSQSTMIPAKNFSGIMDHSIMDKTYKEKWVDCLAKIQINSANY